MGSNGAKQVGPSEKRFSFTRAALRDLAAPREGWAYFYDDSVRGLAIGVGATGAKSFLVYRKVNGRPVRVTLGLFDPAIPETRELEEGSKPLDLLGHSPKLNVRMARKLATAVNASLDLGVNPAEEKRRQRQKANAELTLGDLFERYRDYLVAEGKKGVKGVVWYFERYLGALPSVPVKKHGRERTKAKGSVNWQDRRLSMIQREDVARLRAELAKNISPTSANRTMELLKAIYNFGRKQELYAGGNPVAGLPKFKLQSRERRIQRHEAQKFFHALNTETDRDFQDYVYLSICTGARRGNVLRMQWNEVSLDGSAWRVSSEKMKNGEPLVIPLIPKALEILQRRAEKANGSPWVFPGNTPAGHAGPFRGQWERFVGAAEVPDLRIHDLRRTLGSWMSSTGASTVMTMRALGHKTIDAALVYQRLELSPVREAMEAGVHGLLKAAEPEPQPEPPKPDKVVQIPKTLKRQARGAKAGR